MAGTLMPNIEYSLLIRSTSADFSDSKRTTVIPVFRRIVIQSLAPPLNTLAAERPLQPSFEREMNGYFTRILYHFVSHPIKFCFNFI